MRAHAWLVLRCVAVLLPLMAAGGCSKRAPARAGRVTSTAPLPVEPATVSGDAAIDWAAQVGHTPLIARGGSQPSAAKAALSPPLNVQPATMADHAFEASGSVPARHLVYRVTFIVPTGLRKHRPPISAPAGELHVDVAKERLRARFVGPGWPVEDGTEVRLRDDIPGVYLFDGTGGRPLAPGQLAGWFQGSEANRTKSLVYVHRDLGNGERGGPGELLCALLAEWTQQDREDLLPLCRNGALPLGFHFGLWSAELTAIVPLEVARGKLRADAGHPPERIAWSPGRTMLEPADIAKLVPVRVRAERRVVEQPVGPEGAVLDIENRTDARVVVVVEGVAVGWVRARTHVRFNGFAPGFYHVGASRPFGQPVMSPNLIHIPGSLRFGRNDPRAPKLLPPP
ncbi:MAG TPA: hypothetical protein VHM19_08290 [Polyangiales bacterium]|nr:hypothetical protein [Polyangiales bacterium]